jgi:molybdate transport system regulatory protein
VAACPISQPIYQASARAFADAALLTSPFRNSNLESLQAVGVWSFNINPILEVNAMKISARNVLPGKVSNITKGAVNAEVVLSLRGGETIVAVITISSVERLGLQTGSDGFAIIKASEVMVGKDLENAKMSARNILGGKIVELHEGAVNSEVGIQLPGGTMLIASITKESVKALDLKQGDAVSAVVKASHVMVGV